MRYCLWYQLKAIRSVAQEVAQHLKKQKPIIIHASKGLEQGTHKRISEVIAEEIPAEKNGKGLWFLSGPSHAEEVAVHDITTITASKRKFSRRCVCARVVYE